MCVASFYTYNELTKMNVSNQIRMSSNNDITFTCVLNAQQISINLFPQCIAPRMDLINAIQPVEEQ